MLEQLLSGELAIDHLNRDQVAQDSLLVVDELLISVCCREGPGQLISCPHEIVIVHVVATSVVGDLDMPGLGQHGDFLLVDTINIIEVCLARLEVV